MEARRMTDPLIAAARFLQSQLEWMRHATADNGEPYAVSAFAEIDWCAGRLRSLVNGPAEQKYLGPCGAPEWVENLGGEAGCRELEGPPCDGNMYVRGDATLGRCSTCGATVSRQEREAWLDGEVRGWAFRAVEIEDAYGINANLIRQWATPARNLVQVHGHDREGRALYLLSEVLDVAATQAAKRAEAQAKRARKGMTRAEEAAA
jgi:hypothetical protein